MLQVINNENNIFNIKHKGGSLDFIHLLGVIHSFIRSDKNGQSCNSTIETSILSYFIEINYRINNDLVVIANTVY